ncbi:MAG TPA: double-strand break repair protein AddB [Hyphomicrobiales bacterium]
MGSTQHELPLFAGGHEGSGTRVFTIPPCAPFLDTLAAAILNGDLPREGGSRPSPFDLAAYQIYLPNRAACRAMGAAFLRASDNKATLLPRIRPLGSAEEDLLLLFADETDEERPDLPVEPAIGPLERRLSLSKLVLHWAQQLREGRITGETGLRIADTPAAATELALDLMRLMDEAETEGVDLRRLAELIPERFAGHEQLSLSFLNIVVQIWPAVLAEAGRLNPVDRRNRLMALEARRLRETRPETPVIVAGSTGSIPATAELMKAVHGLPNGAIVLPGADLMLDDESWNAIADHPEHPQAGLRELLGQLGAARADIACVRGAEPSGSGAARLRLMSEALRPASTIGKWPGYMAGAETADIRDCLGPVSLIAAPTEQEEAAAIALILREVIETPDKTANLITPDRTLARRVAAELGRWDIRLETSAGEALKSTPAAIFYDLIAEYAATGAQTALLALLKHPLTRLGLPEGAAQTAACVLEVAAVRQPWCGDGLDALARSLDIAERHGAHHPAIKRLNEMEWAAARDLIDRLQDALQPLAELGEHGADSVAQLAVAHARCATVIAADEAGNPPLHSPDGDAMSIFMAALSAGTPGPELTLAEYPALFRSLIRLETVRSTTPAHPRLQILSAMEARLTSADLVILAGLNEGVWPEAADPGPWLNRTMRDALGLPPPERRTRLAAHDVWQMAGAAEVILTRSLKSGGAPTVASRWLMRLEALLTGMGLDDALAPPKPWLAWAMTRNDAAAPSPVKAPAPCPPFDARPRRLSVSDIETLIANPYAIYAKHILGLQPLADLDAELGGSERGQIIHDILHRFARRYPDSLPKDCARELMAIFDKSAALYGDQPRISAFWRPRLERFAAWFTETEAERRGEAIVFTEQRGEFEFETDRASFTLTARADRIDLHPDGGLAIYDYKSGTMPGDSAVAAFKAPQLPLEALIAATGGFDGVDSDRVIKLAYISAKGGEPPGAERALTKGTPDALAEGAHEGLVALINRFDEETTPYSAIRRTAFADTYRYDPYAHLARVAEWVGADDGSPQ